MKKGILLIAITTGMLFACNSTDRKQEETHHKNDEIKKEEVAQMQSNEPNYLINSNQVGYLNIKNDEIKLNPQEVLSEENKTVSEEGVTYLQTFKYVLSTNNDTLIEINNYGIWILNEKYKTEENIRVGSSLTDFYALFEDAKTYYSYVSELLWMSTEKYKGIKFILPNEAYNGNLIELTETDLVELQSDKIIDDSKIIKIQVFQTEYYN